MSPWYYTFLLARTSKRFLYSLCFASFLFGLFPFNLVVLAVPDADCDDMVIVFVLYYSDDEDRDDDDDDERPLLCCLFGSIDHSG